jgi:hypothetical protein
MIPRASISQMIRLDRAERAWLEQARLRVRLSLGRTARGLCTPLLTPRAGRSTNESEEGR